MDKVAQRNASVAVDALQSARQLSRKADELNVIVEQLALLVGKSDDAKQAQAAVLTEPPPAKALPTGS